MAPNILLDTLLAELGLTSDYALSAALELPMSEIDRIRNQIGPVAPAVIIVINERAGMPVYRIRALIAIEPACIPRKPRARSILNM